ncbi:MAG: ABC transporter ATP-binding protein [Sorangiineae bacterium]|nr:ABC transporter ATP-binding protein [Polyangiaceae bacterium]MEB2324018.1 ABC transporter ATP-binding protein [Sorangiineae bacterium]
MTQLRLTNVGKRYRRRRTGRREGFRDALSNPKSLPVRVARFIFPERADWFWALRGVSFSAEPGEIVGLVGKNGSGKSTLLKLVARITPPTEGELELRGRVSSLLEAGAAFHPELSGRENVWLAGALAGMTRREVDAKFDAIVEFAGVGDFIETPLKHYSTGMYLRLAFAVAAHLEPDIAVVDEVLSVGDAGFRARAVDRIGELARAGALVLFVSHDAALVRRMCSRLIIVRAGALDFDGGVDEGLERYERQTAEDAARDAAE